MINKNVLTALIAIILHVSNYRINYQPTSLRYLVIRLINISNIIWTIANRVPIIINTDLQWNIYRWT